MAYELSLSDIESPKGYELSLDDISPSKKLEKMAEATAIPEQQYTPQRQEEFSNPARWPGFENLSPEEKRQRLSLSTFDPANQTATGGFVPGGAYESPVTRAAYSFLPTLAAPQIRGASSILGREVGAPLFNSLSRIGAGTAGNIAYQLPDIKNLQDLENAGLNSLQMNALLEAGTLPFRIPSHLAETFNPLKYGEQKAAQINNEFSAAKALQKETYRPVMEKYGDYNVTLNPENYMSSMGIERKKLYHQTKQLYDDFMNEPTFSNLHKLKSQMGSDLRSARMAMNKPASVSRFSDYSNKLKEKTMNYLSHDKDILAEYEKGNEITRNLVEPYRSTPGLKKLAYGVREDSHPDSISRAIRTGKEKIVATKGENAFTAIPEGHPLENHLRDIEKIMNFGNLAKSVVPTVAGGITGHLLSPGFGTAGGLTGGAGIAASLLSKIGNPLLESTAQNPAIQNVFRTLSPAYYGGGRAFIGEQGR